MLGATVYTFSIILAVFLIGLGLGSSVGSLLARVSQRPRIVLGGCQLLLTAAILWSAMMLADSLPYWPIDPALSKSPWLNFQLDLVRCMWAVLPATCLWGASFPLALAARARPGQDPGRLVGGVYAANTVGAIVGAVGSSLFLIRGLGTQGAQQVLVGLSGLAGLIMLGPYFQRPRTGTSPDGAFKQVRLKMAGSFLLAAILVGPILFLAWCVPGVPWELVAFGRSLPGHESGWKKLYMGEGMNSSVAVTEVAGRGTFMSAGRSRHRQKRRTCGSSGCSAISRRSYIPSRAPFWLSASGRALRPARLWCTPKLNASSSAKSSR